MPDTKNPPEADKGKSRELTFAEAAKRVQRKVVELVDGKGDDAKAAKVPREKRVAVKAEEILAFKDYGTHVVVVTKDGQKLTSSGEE